MHGEWLWDDRDLIVTNALIHDPQGLWKIWFDPINLLDYLPLKVSVEWIEWRIWGNDTLGYHLLNVVLHLLSVFLLWRLFYKMGLRFAWLGALIFTVHPVLVESVAWIAELKNTLSLPFFLLAMMAWIDFDAQRKTRDYLLALGLFILALLSKPTMIMFPFIILLYAWWKRGRIDWRDLRASAAFFAASLAMGIATVWFLNRTAGEQSVVLGGLMSRLACAGLCIAFYFSKCVLPIDLMAIYPQWKLDPPSPLQFLPWLVLGAVLYFLWTRRAGWGRHVLLGLGFFLINLAPFLGLNAGSYMNYTWVMDHIVYIPIIGLIALAIAGLDQAGTQLAATPRRAGTALIAVAIALLAWSSHGYAKIYVSLESLWGYNVRANPAAALPHNDLAFALNDRGDIPDAIDQLRLAVRLDPRYGDARHNLGVLLLNTGQTDEALTEFQAALQLSPNVAERHYNVGQALQQAGRYTEAMDQFQQAIVLDPNDVQAYNDLAIDLAAERRYPEAIQVLQSAVQIAPDDAESQQNLGHVMSLQSQAGQK
jgi:tetratricopeptide (TPR) repeat protein